MHGFNRSVAFEYSAPLIKMLNERRWWWVGGHWRTWSSVFQLLLIYGFLGRKSLKNTDVLIIGVFWLLWLLESSFFKEVFDHSEEAADKRFIEGVTAGLVRVGKQLSFAFGRLTWLVLRKSRQVWKIRNQYFLFWLRNECSFIAGGLG